MANKFATVARKVTTLSPLMEGKEKIDNDDIIREYKEGITVTGFDFITTDGDTYPVLVFDEDSNKFFFGGAVMNNICQGWSAMFDGDIEKANDELSASGGVKIKFSKSKTKSGNTIILPEVVS